MTLRPLNSSRRTSLLPALLLAACAGAVFLSFPQSANAAAHHPKHRAVQAQAEKPLSAEEAEKQLARLRVNARHALVLDDASGRVILAKDADAVVPIASLTKLMTAMVILDAKQDPKQVITIDRDDVDIIKHSASRLRVGSEMTRHDALKMALMSSENRAAAALARTFPGGASAFVLAVQLKIRSLGLKSTDISEPTGLSAANTSTANDVAKIAAAASRYAEIADITSDKSDQVTINGKPRELHNTDRLVGGKGWNILLSKTGYTEEAGRCLTLRMKSGERHYTVVLLDADGSAQRLNDAAKIRQSLSKLPA